MATTHALISYRIGKMAISNGQTIKKLTFYPRPHPIAENVLWMEDPYDNENKEIIHHSLTI